MNEEHENAERLRQIAKSVATIPPGMNRWRQMASTPHTSMSRLARWRAGAGLAFGLAGVMAAGVVLVSYHSSPQTQNNGAAAHATASFLAPASTPSASASASVIASAAPREVTPSSVPSAPPETTNAVPTSAVPSPLPLNLNYDSNGKSFTVRAGTTVNVVLASKAGGVSRRWQVPAITSGTGLTKASGQKNSDGSAQATFVAKAGNSTVTLESWSNDHLTSGPPDWKVVVTISS